jgi:hypothetical protein
LLFKLETAVFSHFPKIQKAIQFNKKRMAMASAAIGASPQLTTRNIRDDWFVEKRKMNITFYLCLLLPATL